MKIPYSVVRLLFRVAKGCGKFPICLVVLGVAMLSQRTASATTYATAALSDTPVAFWQLNETNDPSTGTLPAADSSGNGLNGTYGTSSQNGFNGIVAPQPSAGYQGFAVGQGALACAAGNAASPVTVPALNLNTNSVTIAMWINPSTAETTFTGLFMNRTGAGDAEGFGFGGSTDGTGMAELGYTWNNNSSATWSYNSGLYPVAGIWQFAALVIQSNSATIYLYYTNANTGALVLSSAVNPIAHQAAAFAAGATFIGSDVSGAAPDGTRVFGGDIAGVAVYNSALTQDQILALFVAGTGSSGLPPSITGQPQDQFVDSGSSAKLSATGIGGTTPISYQWQLNGTNINLLSDSANFTGANSSVLTILNASAIDAGSYHVILNNAIGTLVSSNANVTIQSAALVGQWLTNSTLADISGYRSPGTHDGYDIAGTGSYLFTNDVPPGKSGQSLFLFNGDTGIAISNSSSADASYTNTFDGVIHNSFTVGCFAKGWPGTWNPFVSKYGENGLGWQLRQYGATGINPAWTIRGTGDNDDMAANSVVLASDTNHWHFYVGTYDAVTRVRSLYVDGVLSATETNNGAYALSPGSHFCIGARDNGTSTFGNYFTGQIYDVRAYNFALSASQIVNWYGVVPPFIANQPSPTAVFVGSKATFNVTASGTPPLTYQWQLNGTNVNLLPDAANFIGATSNVLTILSVSANDVGSYQVVVTSSLGYGTATSSSAALSLVPKVLLGQWFTNGTMTDLSGHSPAGTHDGYTVGGVNYVFTNDVPPGESGQSIQFTSTDTGIAIANSATSDGAYTNTFDTSAFTVAFWAKGRGPFGGNWHAWVAKDGYNNDGEYNGLGWSVGIEAWSQHLYFDAEGVDGGGINYTLGDGLWGNGILESSPQALPGDDSTWHFYAATYNPATGVRNAYFDGALVAQQTGDAPYRQAPDKHLTIGAQEQTTTGFTGFNTTSMYDVRVYNFELSSNQVVAIMPDPVISVQPPQSMNAYVGVTARMRAAFQAHTSPATLQWQLNGTNLVNGAFGGAIISGVNSNILTIANVTTNIQGVYDLILSDPAGTTISSNSTVTVLQTVPAPATNLVGQWVAGATNLTDTSGYSPAGTHDGYGVSGTGALAFGYRFTNDLPPGVTGSSLLLVGNTAIAITNTSDLDGAYTNTFDDDIDTNGMTVMCWAKGLPGSWNPWVSKYGENGAGWQLRVNGDAATPCWTIRGPGGDDMSSVLGQSDGNWHFYAGTYDPVAGVRNLYVDGVLAATESGQGPVTPSTSSHVVIGARDNGGNSYGNYFAGEIYGVRIYNVPLTAAQINQFLVIQKPVFNPLLRVGNQLILSWSDGSLQQATNVLGPWTPTGATSPYTNDVTTAPRMFFRVSNP